MAAITCTFNVQGSGFRVQGLRFLRSRVFGFRVQSLGIKVEGLWLSRVWGYPVAVHLDLDVLRPVVFAGRGVLSS